MNRFNQAEYRIASLFSSVILKSPVGYISINIKRS